MSGAPGGLIIEGGRVVPIGGLVVVPISVSGDVEVVGNGSIVVVAGSVVISVVAGGRVVDGNLVLDSGNSVVVTIGSVVVTGGSVVATGYSVVGLAGGSAVVTCGSVVVGSGEDTSSYRRHRLSSISGGTYRNESTNVVERGDALLMMVTIPLYSPEPLKLNLSVRHPLLKSSTQAWLEADPTW